MSDVLAWPADRRITIRDLQAATDRGERSPPAATRIRRTATHDRQESTDQAPGRSRPGARPHPEEPRVRVGRRQLPGNELAAPVRSRDAAGLTF
jgi:hypothetical protein